MKSEITQLLLDAPPLILALFLQKHGMHGQSGGLVASSAELISSMSQSQYRACAVSSHGQSSNIPADRDTQHVVQAKPHQVAAGVSAVQEPPHTLR